MILEREDWLTQQQNDKIDSSDWLGHQ
jgi:hypothetical protein